MKRLLICPSERPAVSLLAEKANAPLAAVPLLGQSLLEYWLSSLSCAGVKQVTVLVHDRPDHIQALIGDGARWGLQVKVLEESRELTPAQALLKHESELDKANAASDIIVLDHFPAMPEQTLFGSYRELFSALQQWMFRAITPDRVGALEVRPGVWVDSHSVVSPDANIQAPCWIGRHVFVGAGAVIGQNSIIEDGAFIEPQAEVAQSCIGPDTFVGRFARIGNSIAWGNTLIDWQVSSVTEIPDPFLLCALRRPRARRTQSWFDRLVELCSRNKEEAAMAWKHLLLNKEG